MSAARRKGTAAETAVVRYLQANGHPNADRAPLRGANDRGDVTGLPDWCIEVKACREMTLAAWVDEAEREAKNRLPRFGVVWHKRRGKASPGDWYVTMTGATFAALLEAMEDR